MKPLNQSYSTAVVLASLLALASGSACALDDLACGDGTIEQDGTCVTADSSKDPASCGSGTMFDPESQTCVSEFEPTECDPATTIPVTEDGVTTCVGVGGDADCNTPLPCPNADTGKVTVCGQLIDVGTGQRIELDGESNADCDPMNPADTGPCSIGLALYDALAFAGNPQGTPPLPVEELSIDECGRFQAVNVERPAMGAIGLGMDDHPAISADTYVLSGSAFLGVSGETVRGFNAYIADGMTNDAWTASAGNPPELENMSFAEKGAYLTIYHRGSARVSGVQITKNGVPQPENSFYFSDSDALTLRTVDSNQTETGTNGAGLLLNSTTLGQHSGLGGEAQGCEWLSILGTGIPGVIFTQEQFMIDSMTSELCL